MLTKKERSLLQLLYQKGDFQTSKELAQELNLSERTIRTYLKNLEDELSQQGATLLYQYGQGVRLSVLDQDRFLKFYDRLGQAQKPSLNSTYFEEVEDRLHYLYNKLFFEEEVLHLKDLSNVFHVSKSSLAQLLAQVRKQLSPYNLELKSLGGSRYAISGEELKKRQFMAAYFLSDQFQEIFPKDLTSQKWLAPLDLPAVIEVVLTECKLAHIRLSDVTLTNLLLHLSLSILRQKSGHVLENLPLEDSLSSCEEYRVAERILRKLEADLSMVFPQGEAQHLALHLLSKSQRSDETNRLDRTYEADLQQVLSALDHKLGSQLAKDYILLQNLAAHLSPLLLRLRYHIRLENPLLEEIRQSYNQLFTTIKTELKNLACLTSYQVSDDEWAYFALHVIAALDRQASQSLLKVLVVCATGIGSAQVLRHRLETYYGQRIQIVDCIGYYELQGRSLEGIDLLISSVDLGQVFFPIPTVTVSVFITAEDRLKLDRYLDQVSQGKMALQTDFKEIDLDLMESFEACFSSSRFFLVDRPITKEALLKKMLELLEDVKDEADVERFYQQIVLREQLSSTAFSSRVACPHPMESLSNRAQAVVAILKSPLKWDKDHDAISLVILLSPSRFHNGELKRLSRQLALWVDRRKDHEVLLDKPYFETFRHLFLNTIIKED